MLTFGLEDGGRRGEDAAAGVEFNFYRRRPGAALAARVAEPFMAFADGTAMPCKAGWYVIMGGDGRICAMPPASFLENFERLPADDWDGQ